MTKGTDELTPHELRVTRCTVLNHAIGVFNAMASRTSAVESSEWGAAILVMASAFESYILNGSPNERTENRTR